MDRERQSIASAWPHFRPGYAFFLHFRPSYALRGAVGSSTGRSSSAGDGSLPATLCFTGRPRYALSDSCSLKHNLADPARIRFMVLTDTLCFQRRPDCAVLDSCLVLTPQLGQCVQVLVPTRMRPCPASSPLQASAPLAAQRSRMSHLLSPPAPRRIPTGFSESKSTSSQSRMHSPGECRHRIGRHTFGAGALRDS
jgi:hypothetical protein